MDQKVKINESPGKKTDGYIAKPKGDSWNRMNDPRLFDPQEIEKIRNKIKKGYLNDYAKKVFGF